jgi:hypothetical protein
MLSITSKDTVKVDQLPDNRNSSIITGTAAKPDDLTTTKISQNKTKAKPVTATLPEIKNQIVIQEKSEINTVTVHSNKITSFTILLFLFMLFFLIANFFKLVELEREIGSYVK